MMGRMASTCLISLYEPQRVISTTTLFSELQYFPLFFPLYFHSTVIFLFEVRGLSIFYRSLLWPYYLIKEPEIWKDSCSYLHACFPCAKLSIGTTLYTECQCCRSSLLGYLAQSWNGRHSNAGYSNGSIIPASWYSFCRPQKDDRLSQPHPV